MITLLLVPFLFSITPSSATAGADGASVVVEGRGFSPSAVVRWNGSDRHTVYVSARELRVRLRPSDLIVAEPGFLTVYDPISETGSAGARFEVTAAPVGPLRAEDFLLAPPLEHAPAAPGAAAAVYRPQNDESPRPVERPRVPGKADL